MHVVTKILVVFCAVLSLLLAALTMSYAANATTVRTGYTNIESELLAARVTSRDLESSAAAERITFGAQVRAAADRASAAEAAMRAMDAQRVELRTQLEQEKAKAESIRNQIDLVSRTSDTLADIVKAYRDEVTRLRDDSFSSSRRENELTSRIRDLEGQMTVYEQTVRSLREQLQEVQTTMQARAAGDGGQGAFVHTGTPISARVLEVGKLPSGEDSVTISEGANRNVKPNMLLNVVRDGHFIAEIVILSADAERAKGRVRLKTGEVRPQDLVLSQLTPNG